MQSVARRACLTLVLLTATLWLVTPALAASPTVVVVNYGDTLYSIAVRNGVSVESVVRANALPSAHYIWPGQRLLIPSGASAARAVPLGTATVHTVQYGDTLTNIAGRHVTSVDAILRTNGLADRNYIFIGQQLVIPGAVSAVSPAYTAPAAAPGLVNPRPAAPTTGKWIDIDISQQTITAFEGDKPLKTVLVSTGVAAHPTPLGTFQVYLKIASQTMVGGVGAESYRLPNVPWIMYFQGGNSIHGTYWHKNFGRPMSHGCVNLTIPDAKWFYDWAPLGTPVVVHP